MGGGGGEGGWGGSRLGEVQNIRGGEKFRGLALKRIPASRIDLQVFTIRPNFRMG